MWRPCGKSSPCQSLCESRPCPTREFKKDSAPAHLRTSPGAVALGKAASKHPVMACANIGALGQET